MDTVRSVAILTDDNDLRVLYKKVCDSLGIKYLFLDKIREEGRVFGDLFICESGLFFDTIPDDLSKTVIVLKSIDDFRIYLRFGVNRFVFNRKNLDEVMFSLLVDENVEIEGGKAKVFKRGDYLFDFARNEYKYKKENIYVTEVEKKYLENMVRDRKKDNDKRMVLCRMRKKFGEGFLKDIFETKGTREMKNGKIV